MRKILSGLVLVGAVVLPMSLAQAATEVMRLPANNTFANAISNDPVTGVSTGIFVSRHVGDRGGPVDTLFYVISNPDFTSCSGGGVLPSGAFHVDAQGASLNVDVNDMVLTNQQCDVPGDGIISVDWSRTSSTRDSGSTQFNFGTIHVLFVGTAVDTTCDVDANAFGVDLGGTFGDIRSLHEAVIIITKD